MPKYRVRLEFVHVAEVDVEAQDKWEAEAKALSTSYEEFYDHYEDYHVWELQDV